MSFDLKKIGTVVNTIKKCIDVAAEACNTAEKSSEPNYTAEDLQKFWGDDLKRARYPGHDGYPDSDGDAEDEPLGEYQAPNTVFGGNGTYYPPSGYNGYSNAYAYAYQQTYPNGFGTQQQGYPQQTTYQPQQSGYQWTYF